MLTGQSSTESAIAALRQGAFDYLTKPCKFVQLETVLAKVANKRELTNKYRAAQRQLQRLEGEPQLIGESPALAKVRTLIEKVEDHLHDVDEPGL